MQPRIHVIQQKLNPSSMNISIFENPPEGFNTKIQAAVCYIEIDGKFLVLQEAKSTGLWGVPGGKLEPNEAAAQAARRELFEETGLSIDASQFQFFGTLFIRKSDMDYVFHLFKVQLEKMPEIRLSPEHARYMWATRHEMEKMSLISGEKEALKYYDINFAKKMRKGASVNAYLILRQEEKVLLHLRKNSGYYDGCYGLVSGHVEDGESAASAIIREAEEEAGIRILPTQLKFAHLAHRQTDRLNVDIFFECHSWRGTVQNKEPEKCAGLEYFSLNHLPTNTIDYVADTLMAVHKGECYSERGWEKS